MSTRNVSTEIKSTYSELKEILLDKGCMIISEESPTHIVVRHGSLRGVSPRSAKKVVDFRISPHNSGARIFSQSSVSPDWANLTLWGNVAAAVMATIFWWIASDITNLLVDGTSNYWSWLARAFGYPNIQYAFFMVNLTKALSIVLFVVIILEIIDVFIVYRKISTFAEMILDELTKNQK